MILDRFTRAAMMALLATNLFVPAMLLTTPASASDDDIICFNTECGTRGSYEAECKLTDTSEICDNVNSARRFRAGAVKADLGTSIFDLNPPEPNRRF